jgi:antagonist of KipI
VSGLFRWSDDAVTFEVLEPGLLTTVQDAGRPDWTHLGVPVGGACDPWSFAVANLLAGSERGAAALEMTIVGPTLAVREPVTIGLAGADLGGVVRETGRRLLPGASYALASGLTIAFPGGDPDAAARAYLAVGSGVEVALALGSRSTVVSAGLGGIDGRAIRAGDVIRQRSQGSAPERQWPWLDGDPLVRPARRGGATTLRVIPGPSDGIDALIAATWRVRPESDRVGLRLEPQDPHRSPALPGTGELLTHGVVTGAIQLPPGGTPLVLLADHQTTGGYPVAGVVARADHPALGQLAPGSAVRFVAVTPDEARAAFVEQAAAFDRGAAALDARDPWDELSDAAGG